MPAAAVPPPSRRWPRRLAWAAGVLALLAGALWWLAPELALALVRDRLPLVATFPHGQAGLTALATGGPATVTPEAQVLVPAGRARRIAGAASGWWLPPGVLRSGQRASGWLALPLLRPTPFASELLIGGGGEEPLVVLRLGAGDLDRFLDQRGRTYLEVGGKQLGQIRYQVETGRVEDDGPPLVQPSGAVVRRFRATASGAIDLWAVGDLHRHLVVRRMDGIATATITPRADGLALSVVLEIGAYDAEELSLPLVGDLRPLLIKQLEVATNRAFADLLDGLVLPAWLPQDVRIDAEVYPAVATAAPTL
jgi:hypothetical protein